MYTDMEESASAFEHIITRNSSMIELFEHVRRVAPIDIPVLLTGESGTGKELFAKAIHRLSHRKTEPFIPVNTGAISPELIISELFGHEKGSYTGAHSRGIGKFEMAGKGTLFLDEIGTMNTNTQVALLRILETGKFQRVGAQTMQDSFARIIAATNTDLADSINNGTFREDLFHRLNVFPVVIPPLRERADDIPLLIDYFTQKYCKEFSMKPPAFSKSAIEVLKAYPWKGNVRELENMVMRLIVNQSGKRIDAGGLPEEIQEGSEALPDSINIEIGTTLEDAELEILQETLHYTRGNKKKAAEILDISRKAFYNKLKQDSSD
jgi:two-component system, NtrC family, response regulator AtoC